MTLSITATVSAWSPTRVLLNVSSSPAVTNVLRVYRVHEDGSRNRVLTDGRAVLNGTWWGYDYHAPFNQPFAYVASTGLEESPASAACFLPSDDMWLMHAQDPSLSMVVTVTKVSGRKTKSSAQSFDILGSTRPVVVSSSRRGPQSWTMEILAEDADETAALEALFDSDLPVLVNSARSDRLPWSWVRVDDLSVEPPGGYFRTDLRLVSFSCVQCSAPDVDVKPVWTYADAKVAFPGAYTTTDGVWSSYGRAHVDLRG